jgi:hypothetical protein
VDIIGTGMLSQGSPRFQVIFDENRTSPRWEFQAVWIFNSKPHYQPMNIRAIAREHQDLIDIDEVQSFDPKTDQPLFDEIKAVLRKHGALHRFGITLLHKHFDVYEGEKLVECCDEESRTLTLRPVRNVLKKDESYVETNWRFDVDSTFANQLCFADCLKMGKTHKEIHKKK